MQENQPNQKLNHGANNNVLVVEDSKFIQSMIRNVLQFTNYNAVMVSTGKGAIEIMKNSKEGKFKTILLDLLLPDINGMDVIDTIRKTEGKKAKTFVIAVTGNYEGHSKKTFKKRGFNAVIHKPFEDRHIINVLDALSKQDVNAWLGLFDYNHFSL